MLNALYAMLSPSAYDLVADVVFPEPLRVPKSTYAPDRKSISVSWLSATVASTRGWRFFISVAE